MKILYKQREFSTIKGTLFAIRNCRGFLGKGAVRDNIFVFSLTCVGRAKMSYSITIITIIIIIIIIITIITEVGGERQSCSTVSLYHQPVMRSHVTSISSCPGMKIKISPAKNETIPKKGAKNVSANRYTLSKYVKVLNPP